MTKQNMIETIRREESRLWTELALYDNLNAPDDGDHDREIWWDRNDAGHLQRMNQWYAVSELLDKLGITADHDDRAYDLRLDLFLRREASRGNREEATA